MDEYIDVKIDVFEHVDQRARLRKSLTVSALVEEILKEFDDVVADSPEKYAVYLKGIDRPLNPGYTLTQLDIQPQDELVFNYVRQTIRQMLEPHQYAFLSEETTGKTYDIQWQPAVIGRPTNEVDHNIVLAVNVQLLPNGMTVSRKHAQITFSEGRYYVEALAENNPVFINGKEVTPNSRREIKNGDKLLIGRNKIVFTFTTQQQTAPAPKDTRARPVSQPLSQPVPLSQPASQPVYTPPPASAQMPADIDQNKTFMASEETIVASLVIERSATPESIGQRIKIAEYPFVLGRSIPLFSLESEVSRRHAELSLDRQMNKFYITDLKSTNGVTLEDVPIEPTRPYEIKSGSRIGLGHKLVLKFEF
jgi:pSer/pThr/pTyr-binding forkhead associated (FHA) protein